MEILIIGGIIVALMIYASTRIKRSAAEAFEEEKIDTENFSLVKPEGFLNPVVNESDYAFYAYSKEFGEEEKAEKLRQGLIKVKALAGMNPADLCKDIKNSFDAVFTDEKTGDGAILLAGEKNEKDVEKIFYHKIVAQNEWIFDLEIMVLADYREKYEEKAEKLLASFRVK